MNLNKITDPDKSVSSKNNLNRFLLATAFIALAFSQTFAKPASPWPMQRTQADGSKVTVMQQGNEYFHYFKSTDGYLLLPDSNGVLYYADKNSAISAHKAHNVNERTSEESKFLSSFNKDSVIAKHYKANADNIKANMEKRKPRTKPILHSASGKPVPWDGASPNTGTAKGVVILVQFTDSTFHLTDPRAEYNNFMNKAGYSNYCNSGSCRDYYVDMSDSIYKPSFDVYGPVTLSHPESYYGANSGGWDANAEQMISDACTAINSDTTIAFGNYDNDNDGTVDFIYVFYAGMGESDGGAENTIWPHSYNISLTLDNTKLSLYATSNEANGASGKKGNFQMDGIATFCHEFGHVLGLPDLYQTNGNNDAETPGDWDEMDVGCYNSGSNSSCGNTSTCPPSFSATELYTLDWLKPTKLAASTSTQVLPNLTQKKAYKLPGTSDTTEFFMLENRQQSGWDAGLPGHGMLIWHIDYDKTTWADAVNNNASHQYEDIEEASGTTSSSGAASFPGTAQVTKFTKFTMWSGTTLKPSVYNITETNGVIYFTTDSSIQITNVNNNIKNIGNTNSQITASGNKLLIKTSVSGEKNLCLYGLNGQLLGTEKLTAAHSSVPLDKMGLGLKGMVIARLTSDGKLLAQESITLP